jgi:ketosteroid isomerase-like protein
MIPETTRALVNRNRNYRAKDRAVADRLKIERPLRELYAARVRGDLDGVCRLFADDARFQIAGASQTNPISVTAVGVDEFRRLLALMIKSFKLTDQTTLSMIIDGMKAAVHWRATVHSRITGTTVVTELVDVIEVRDGRIASYTEFFAPR